MTMTLPSPSLTRSGRPPTARDDVESRIAAAMRDGAVRAAVAAGGLAVRRARTEVVA